MRVTQGHVDSLMSSINTISKQLTDTIRKQKYLCLSLIWDQRQEMVKVRESKTEEHLFQEHIEAPSTITAQACEAI